MLNKLNLRNLDLNWRPLKTITKEAPPTQQHEQNVNNLNVLTGLGIQLPVDQAKFRDFKTIFTRYWVKMPTQKLVYI